MGKQEIDALIDYAAVDLGAYSWRDRLRSIWLALRGQETRFTGPGVRRVRLAILRLPEEL